MSGVLVHNCLALGYNGGIASLRAMGAEGTDEALQMLVDQWRMANPAIVDLWRVMGDSFKLGGPVGEHLAIERDGQTRRLRLPSGRAIEYHDVKFEWVTTSYGGRRQQPTFSDPKKVGLRAKTYGGRACENVTQAIARDLLAESLVRLHQCGYNIVGHIHDEVLVEGVGEKSVQAIRNAMCILPEWAIGIPIDAAGFTADRYRK